MGAHRRLWRETRLMITSSMLRCANSWLDNDTDRRHHIWFTQIRRLVLRGPEMAKESIMFTIARSKNLWTSGVFD
jgi:hypothetical protein